MKTRSSVFYGFTLLLFGSLGYYLLQAGSVLETAKNLSVTASEHLDTENFFNRFHHPLALLFIQIIVVCGSARFVGYLFTRKLKQPSVMGEIVAGILLGPSLLGYYFPETMGFLFPPASLPTLGTLSQIGLVLFMFIIGMELDLSVLKNKAHSAIIISHASIIFPFFLGMILAYYFYTDYAPKNVGFLSFSLFMGIAMSITAFPVLARILQERNLTRTPLGAMVLTCAAADDITAWILLAIIVTISKAGNLNTALFTIGLSFAYILTMIYLVAPFLKRLGSIYISRENLTRTAVALILMILFLSSLTTEVIGIHALFGAFLAGVIMPAEGNLKKLIAEKIEDIAVILFLPIFFVITGLRTEVTLLNGSHLWLVFGLVLLVAVVGKFLGSAFAARVAGSNWEDSLSIGALMNTRGLMELVVLNIGYDLGILSPEIFAVFVMMALVTTLSTGPLLDGIQKFFTKTVNASYPEKPSDSKLRVLVAFAQEKMGKSLVRFAFSLSGNQKKNLELIALHISPNDSLSNEEIRKYRDASFEAIRQTGSSLGIQVQTEYRITDNVTYEIVNFAKIKHSDILLIGAAKPLFSRSYTGGKIKGILNYCPATVGVLIDNGLETIERIAILYKGDKDPILGFAQKLTSLKGMKSNKIKVENLIQPETDLNPYPIAINQITGYSLILIDLNVWEELGFEKMDLLPTSFLLVRFLTA
ncbi:cation:proton antiporter [Leptospira levettii]|uniref:Cation:proton antiporter n=1 Tax=Leptospira paudalimensis TaxID=2950024 RepID=A0ABT3MB51_9LEPT|nr:MULTISPECIES: cation:proton antiporter [Leptospira]MCW7496203.1 cation:proton antiporter [Leptospira levettii]MCW7505623.1 cation:proton antiporter [Leptospira paudalimensis]